LKYEKILSILSDIAECTNEELILVGGTALALFHTKHRISVDLDFVPSKNGDDAKLKEKLKGCMSSKGHKTQRTVYENQFVIQFDNTGIKVELFIPDYIFKKIEKHEFGDSNLLVASVDDIYEMKLISYKSRKASRDLFDIFFILKDKGLELDPIIELIKENGPPENLDEIEGMAYKKEDFNSFKKVVENASKASS
jgi:predicted nucleotidyltransferase component of viral defense system